MDREKAIAEILSMKREIRQQFTGYPGCHESELTALSDSVLAGAHECVTSDYLRMMAEDSTLLRQFGAVRKNRDAKKKREKRRKTGGG